MIDVARAAGIGLLAAMLLAWAAGCSKSKGCGLERTHAKNSWALVAEGATLKGKKVQNDYTRAAAELSRILAAEPGEGWGDRVHETMKKVMVAHAKQLESCGDDDFCKKLWRRPKAALAHTERALEFCR